MPGYEIIERLGKGGMGVVYKARQKSLGRIVALKMILAGAHASDENRMRFRLEAEAVARLAHPNIVQIHEVGEHAGQPFLSLEFVEGGTLDKKLHGTPVAPREAARLVEILARATHHAHLQGVVHRDLKPANVLLSSDGVPKITDFGLARLGAGSGETRTGDILGTPSYMAPEQAAGRSSDVGPAADIYALGATLYELLTGRPPFRTGNPIDTLRQVLDQEPVSPSQVRPGLPRDLVIVCMKCLHKTPAKRYATAEALADDLRRVLDGHPILARQTPTWERVLKWTRRRPALASLYVVLAATAVMFIVYTLWLRHALNDANSQRGIAVQASEERRRQLVQVLLGEGIRQLEEGDWLGALLPLTEAARLDHVDTDRAAVHALRLSTILRQCPRLVQFWSYPEGIRHAAFARDGDVVLIIAGARVRLLDSVGGKEIARLDHNRPVRTARSSADGKRLVTATDDRRIHVWDLDKAEPLAKLGPAKGNIAGLAFLADTDRILAVTRVAEQKISIQCWDVKLGKPVSPELPVETGVLFDFALSPDGKHAFATGATSKIWELPEGRVVFEENESQQVTQACFSADNRFIAGADVSGAIRVWDITSGKKIATARHTPPLRDLAFSPDGRFVVSGGLDGAARVWRLPEAVLAAELRHGPAFTHAVSHVAFSPDGRHSVLVVGANNTARVWDGVRAATPLLRHSDRVTHSAFSPDGRRVVTACADGTVRIWDLATGRLAGPALEQDDRVNHVDFDEPGRKIVTATEDGVARIWDVATGRSQGMPFVHDFVLRGVAYAGEDRIAIVGEDPVNGEGEACLWDIAKRARVFRRPTAQKVQGITPKDTTQPIYSNSFAYDRGIRRAWFSPSGHKALALFGNGQAQVWDTRTGEAITGILEHKSSINGASFSANEDRLVTNTFVPEYSAHIWETAGKPLNEFYRQLRVDNTATVWQLPAGKSIASIGESGSAAAFRHAVFVQGDRLLLVHDGAAELRDPANGSLLRGFRKPGTKVTHAELSPDGKTLVTLSDDRTAQLWHAETGELKRSPPQFQHSGQKGRPVFSRDSRLLALETPGGVRIWDAVTGEPISPPLLHAVDVNWIAFNPDGKLLATASDNAARLWPLQTETLDFDDYLLVAQMLSGLQTHAEDARVVPLRAEELASLWDKVRSKVPSAFTTAKADATAWYAEAARVCERNQLWTPALATLGRLTRLEPRHADFFDRHGRAAAELGRFKEAATAIATATTLGVDRPGPWYRLALLRLHLDDRQAYEQARDAMLEQFEAAKDGIDAQLVVRTGVLAPAEKEAARRILALAERHKDARPKDHHALLMHGAALYRVGRHEEAVAVLLDAKKLRGADDAQNDLFLALCYLRMKKPDAAQTHIQQAARSIGKSVAPSGIHGRGRAAWSERLELLVLRRELQAVLKEKS